MTVEERTERVKAWGARIKLEDEAAEAAKKGANGHNGNSGPKAGGQFDIDSFIARHLQVHSGFPKPYCGGRKWEVDCPFNPDHDRGEAVVLQAASGVLGFKCQHNSCAEKNWRSLRDLFEPAEAPKQPPAQKAAPRDPVGLSVAEVLALKRPEQRVLIEGVTPAQGVIFFAGDKKTGKTVVAVQMAISVATGLAFLNSYTVHGKGPVLIVEQDDPAGALSVQDYFKASPIPVDGLPITTFERTNHYFGPTFSAWLAKEITRTGAKLVILDSYTALRPSRERGGDIVKVESDEVTMLNELALNTNCLILALHHDSKGTFGQDWSDRIPGTYAMGAASDGQIHISRFRELLETAKERLIRVRLRHGEDHQMVIRFRKDTLDYELVFDGPASSMFPEIQQIHTEFGTVTFSPKELIQATGWPRATAFRTLARLRSAGAVIWQHGGVYSLAPDMIIAMRGIVR